LAFSKQLQTHKKQHGKEQKEFKFFLREAVLVGKMAAFFCLRLTISGETIDKYVEDTAVDGSLLHKELGFVPKYDLEITYNIFRTFEKQPSIW
jgi:hypothetical protein